MNEQNSKQTTAAPSKLPGKRGRAPIDPSYRAFIDGLRDCLGLDPIYPVDAPVRSDLQRFYVGVHSESTERTPVRGAT